MSTNNFQEDHDWVTKLLKNYVPPTSNSDQQQSSKLLQNHLSSSIFDVSRDEDFNTKNVQDEEKKMEMKKEFYRIIKDLEDHIKQNKER